VAIEQRLELGVKQNGGIRPISVPKASDILADRIRQMILSGEIQPGESLPPERDLVTSSGLSRSSVRDALRVLEVEGLITTKPGRSGGSIVQLPGRDSVARSMELFVKSHEIQLHSLLDCRLAIEPFLAAKAAENRTDSDLEEIQSIHSEFVATTDDIGNYKRLNLEWHLAVARASHNEILIALMEAISHPILEAAGYQQVTTDSIREEAKRAHEAIVEAIANSDGELAGKRMAKHLGAYIDVAQTINRKA
jgi:GntR family transcriptional repressor for pyruvate dehydrogenase complex